MAGLITPTRGEVRYRDKLSGLNKHALTDRKIGFCWSSGIRLKGAWIKEFGMRKSMHFDKISPLVKACWDQDIGTPISLQIGPERDQEFDIIDMLPARPSWDETAGLIAHLDLDLLLHPAVLDVEIERDLPTLPDEIKRRTQVHLQRLVPRRVVDDVLAHELQGAVRTVQPRDPHPPCRER